MFWSEEEQRLLKGTDAASKPEADRCHPLDTPREQPELPAVFMILTHALVDGDGVVACQSHHRSHLQEGHGV